MIIIRTLEGCRYKVSEVEAVVGVSSIVHVIYIHDLTSLVN